MPGAQDQHTLMRAALRQAEKALGDTSPNPAVGALLVVGSQIAATGHHREAGAPHAEVDCLRNYGQRVPSRAILYVTLEPCSTAGRTPPCTDAIIAAGVQHVIIGAIDPNPQHAGRGIELLQRAGITVETGVLAEECRAVNQSFNKWIQTGRPFVVAKCGMTLDGRLTAPPGEPRWITSLSARRHANRRRGQVDAVLVGAETIRADNPRLTVREVKRKRQPWRVIVTRSGRLPRDARVFTDRYAARTLIFEGQSLDTVLAELGRREIMSVLIEGGGEVLSQALDAQLIDRLEMYLGPILTGGPVLAFGGKGAPATADALRLRGLRYERIADDILVVGDATPAASLAE